METEGKKKINKVKLVFYCIFGAIIAFLLVMEISILSQKYIKKSTAPTFLGYGSFIVLTGSMNGTIEEGDMIIIKRTNDYKPMDIVTYVEYPGAKPVTHRIILPGSEEGKWITKGDANSSIDIKEISNDQIVGEVVLVIPKVGLFFNWIKSEGGWVYILAIGIILIAMIYLVKQKPEDKDEKNEKGENKV